MIDDRSPGAPLAGRAVPPLTLPTTAGRPVGLADSSLGSYVLFLYPRTGRADEPASPDWSAIPGATGCTAESCAFRDLTADYAAAGYRIFGLSSQRADEQQEAADRLGLSYALLSDPHLRLAHALGLPTFTFRGSTLYERSTLVISGGRVAHAALRITDAAAHPAELLEVLRAPA